MSESAHAQSTPARGEHVPQEWYGRIRPGIGRTVPMMCAAVMFGAALVAAFTLPQVTPGHRGGWGIADRGMLLAFVGLISWFLLRYAMICADVTPQHIVVRNLFITRTIPWAHVSGVRYVRGDPWAYMDLSDDDTVAVMAVQAADGALSQEYARRLATLALVHGGVG